MIRVIITRTDGSSDTHEGLSEIEFVTMGLRQDWKTIQRIDIERLAEDKPNPDA